MDWPARSPDLNPIEHVWDFLGRRLAARTLPPVTIRELRLALLNIIAHAHSRLLPPNAPRGILFRSAFPPPAATQEKRN
ncbi:hypothetical protein TNCV_929091 [Trichonephila clavipes]|nr:hypothetical protein TNCV_929091 [Trichonephila clavipes]